MSATPRGNLRAVGAFSGGSQSKPPGVVVLLFILESRAQKDTLVCVTSPTTSGVKTTLREDGIDSLNFGHSAFHGEGSKSSCTIKYATNFTSTPKWGDLCGGYVRVLFIDKSSSHTRRDDCVYQESTRCSTKGVGREGSCLHIRKLFVQRT